MDIFQLHWKLCPGVSLRFSEYLTLSLIERNKFLRLIFYICLEWYKGLQTMKLHSFLFFSFFLLVEKRGFIHYTVIVVLPPPSPARTKPSLCPFILFLQWSLTGYRELHF